ncbi:MAG: bifunctional UDP-N-acetylglucosamine diphosphorylase/glucosamine-1-phosphate N-acetyltransferase GlmU, partial [Actinomycetales bacterium]
MSARVTAVVLAAGAGTRMKSSRAKVLHEIGGRSLVAHALTAVRDVGASTTVTVVGHDREQVSSAVTDLDPTIVQVVQEEQRGTGHAVRVALDALEEEPEGTVLVTYADVPLLTGQTLTELVLTHRHAKNAVTIL